MAFLLVFPQTPANVSDRPTSINFKASEQAPPEAPAHGASATPAMNLAHQAPPAGSTPTPSSSRGAASTSTARPPGPAARTTTGRALGAAVATTAVVTLVSYVAHDYAATGVGLVFCAAVAWLVLRHDTKTISHFGLSFGGFLEPEPIVWRTALLAALRAVAWAAAFALVLFPPFAVGFRIYWHLELPFHWKAASLMTLGDEALGQLLVVSFPEEAFYRGYLMTALDDAWGTPWKIGGARVGWGLVVSCAIFALGHVLTQPDPGRLAVFFPALLFGWLRARTQGIGAGVVLHAMCNLFSSTLARGYGFGLR